MRLVIFDWIGIFWYRLLQTFCTVFNLKSILKPTAHFIPTTFYTLTTILHYCHHVFCHYDWPRLYTPLTTLIHHSVFLPLANLVLDKQVERLIYSLFCGASWLGQDNIEFWIILLILTLYKLWSIIYSNLLINYSKLDYALLKFNGYCVFPATCSNSEHPGI